MCPKLRTEEHVCLSALSRLEAQVLCGNWDSIHCAEPHDPATAIRYQSLHQSATFPPHAQQEGVCTDSACPLSQNSEKSREISPLVFMSSCQILCFGKSLRGK